MSYTETENLKLRKDNGDEKIVDWRTHSNANMDTIDEAVQNLVEVCANAKSLLGQLGLDESGNPLIDAASARNTLGAATSGGASKSLYAAEQSIATNASNITKLQNSVSRIGNFRLERVAVTVPANANNVSVTAPTVSGYTFVCWLGCCANGWVNWTYLESLDRNPTKLWKGSTETVTRSCLAFALYHKA